jgi:hypothetical protein
MIAIEVVTVFRVGVSVSTLTTLALTSTVADGTKLKDYVYRSQFVHVQQDAFIGIP